MTTDQTTLSEETICPCCLEPYTPERLGDTDVCTDCFPGDDRTDAAMRKVLADPVRVLPWEAS